MKNKKNPKLNFVFFGTPDVAVETLDILHTNSYVPTVIVTSPDRPAGRGLVLTPPPVKLWAQKHSIPCLQPEKLNSEFLAQFESFKPQISIVVAYGKIMPQNVIDLPDKGTVNIHYSLLPKYRGASPVESAVLNGDTETGVDIQQMALGLDTGDILVEEKVAILSNETAPDLRTRLIEIGGKLLVNSLQDIVDGVIKPKKQNNVDASHCSKIKKSDGEIDLSGDQIQNYNKYRAYFGWPGVYFFKDGKRIKITKARFENGEFIPERVIPEGKKEMDYLVFNKK